MYRLTEKQKMYAIALLALILVVSQVWTQSKINQLENEKEDNTRLFNNIWLNYNQFQQLNIKRYVLENTRDTLRVIYNQTESEYALNMIEIYNKQKLDAARTALKILVIADTLPANISKSDLDDIDEMDYGLIEFLTHKKNDNLQETIVEIQQDNVNLEEDLNYWNWIQNIMVILVATSEFVIVILGTKKES